MDIYVRPAGVDFPEDAPPQTHVEAILMPHAFDSVIKRLVRVFAELSILQTPPCPGPRRVQLFGVHTCGEGTAERGMFSLMNSEWYNAVER